ncbi:hypothetical protein SDC9_212033 [bioreactor metagenome]|uniref:Thiazole biosynthetic enzyme n=1 Tax=bioreactor metagenome TaxID=1076179 RepID=A0A645JLV2_9ZZZZ
MLKHWYTNTTNITKPVSPCQRPQNKPPVKKYDAIVVGAGPGGSSAAYFMAKQGMEVLLLERGPFPGAKNCGGSSVLPSMPINYFRTFGKNLIMSALLTINLTGL